MAQLMSSRAQAGSCLVASGGLLSSGMTVAFPSIYKQQNFTIDASWLGSASHFAMIGGSLAVGPLMNAFGQKIILLVALLFGFIGWSVIGVAGLLVPGRLLTGLSAGIVSAPVSVLVAEISSPSLRAHLTTYKPSAFSLGLFLMYSFGVIFKDQWQMSSQICAVISFVSFISVAAWVKETRRRSTSASYLPFLAALPHRTDVARPFILMVTLTTLKQLSGTTVVLSYAAQLLLAGGEQRPEVGAMWLGGVRLLASLATAPLASRLSRRQLASMGGYVASLSLLIVAGGSSQSLICLLIFVFCSALSSSAFQALIGEVYPHDFRPVCTGLTTTATYTSAFVALHFHPWLLSTLGFHRLLGLYAIIAVLHNILVICFLREPPVPVEIELGHPETRRVNKPLIEEAKEVQ